MCTSNYRPEIDGLRGIAVILVILFHADLGLTGGFVGVDVFFVVSGYLITQIIQQEIASTGKLSLKRFWRRRICRIAPAALLMVFIVVVGAIFVATSREDISDTLLAALTQPFGLANFYFWQTTDYFSRPAELRPLLHTWSLAVEEQFYIFYPLLLVSMRTLPRPVRSLALATLGAVSLALSESILWYYPSASFFLTPFRIWELLVGAFLAHQMPLAPFHRKVSELLSAVGLGMIAWSAYTLSNQSLFPGLQALIPCLGAAAFIAANTGHLSSSGRLLGSRMLVAIGLVSYSLYLVHWPVLVALRHMVDGGPSVLTRVGALIACGVLSHLSWKYVEQPARNASPNFSFRRAVCYYSIATGCLLTVILSAHLISERLSYKPLNMATRLSGSRHSNTVSRIRLPDFGRIIGMSNEGEEISFVLWGDSHARAIGRLCDELATEHGLSGAELGRPGFVPLAVAHDWWTPEGFLRFLSGDFHVRENEASTSFIQC